MPELPEVETIARTLAPCLEGRARGGNHGAEQRHLAGRPCAGAVCAEGPRPVTGTGRRGKVLLVRLAPPAAPDGVTALAFHLKMTGRLFVYPAGTEPGPHTRVVFDLDDGAPLFDDARNSLRAGRQPGRTGGLAVLAKAGARAAGGGGGDFVGLFAGRSAAVKALLLRSNRHRGHRQHLLRTKACFGRASGLPRRAAVCARTSWPRCAAPWWRCWRNPSRPAAVPSATIAPRGATRARSRTRFGYTGAAARPA